MEELGDVLTTDGRTLDVWHVVGVCPLGSLLSAHLTTHTHTQSEIGSLIPTILEYI